MADTKTSALASISGASTASGDVVPIADVSAGATKGITLTEFLAAMKLLGIAVDDLSDVTITSALSNQTLIYSGATWINSAIGASIVGVDPATFNNTTNVTAQLVLKDLDSAISSAASTGIPATLADAAGDTLVATADNVFAKKTKGSNYTFLGVNGSGTVGYLDPRSVPQTVNTQTGTTYTLVLTDAGKLVTLSNASSITLTVPTAASVAFPAGTVIDIAQYGAGQVTVAGAVPPTIQTSSTLKLRTQWSAASLVLSATGDQWFLVGDLEPLGQTVNAQTGTTYTVVIGDAEKVITSSNASAQTHTIPQNSSVAFPIGTHIDFVQIGAGQLTIAAGSGATVNGTPTLKLRAQYSACTAIKYLTNTWVVVGDLASS